MCAYPRACEHLLERACVGPLVLSARGGGGGGGGGGSHLGEGEEGVGRELSTEEGVELVGSDHAGAREHRNATVLELGLTEPEG